MSGSVSILPILQCKLHNKVGLHLQALTLLWALGLHKAPSSLHLHGLLIFKELTRLHKAGLPPVVISPTLGPDWFELVHVNLLHLEKIFSLIFIFDLVNRRDVILQNYVKPP